MIMVFLDCGIGIEMEWVKFHGVWARKRISSLVWLGLLLLFGGHENTTILLAWTLGLKCRIFGFMGFSVALCAYFQSCYRSLTRDFWKVPCGGGYAAFRFLSVIFF